MHLKSVSLLGFLVLMPTLLFAEVSSALLTLNRTSEDLFDIKMISADDGWIVGENGIILHWDGNSWSRVDSPTDQWLHAVDFADKNDGWIVGGGWSLEAEMILLRWNGVRWVDANNLIATPPLKIDQWNWDSWILGDVSVVGSDDVWAVGSWHRQRKLWIGEKEAYERVESGLILHWDGTGWHLSTELGNLPGLSHIFMLDGSTGWIAGHDSDFTYNLYEYNGLFWTGIHEEAQWGFQSIFALESNDVWSLEANSEKGLFHWDGTQWTQTAMPVNYDYGFFGILDMFFLDKDSGWVCGVSHNPPADDMESAIFHWDGIAWKKQATLPFDMFIRDIYMLEENIGWAIGDCGTILKWDGENWSTYASSLEQPFWNQPWLWALMATAAIVIVTTVFVLKHRRKNTPTRSVS